jgi:ribonuclease BN (tRNA processing enzyme)
LNLFGPGVSPKTLEKVLESNQSPATFPVRLREMASSKEIRSLRETQVVVWDGSGIRVIDTLPIGEAGAKVDNEALVVRIHRSYAHPGGVYAYRVTWRGRSIVYATDIEGYVGTDRRLARFAHKADLLIHDAQYSEAHYRGQMAGFPSTQGYGHSTTVMACEAAAAAEAGSLVLFHHDPAYDDSTIDGIEREARVLFKGTQAAYEGLTINFSSPPMGAPFGDDKGAGEAPSSGARAERRVKYVQDGRH